jgi:hypothetical protein
MRWQLVDHGWPVDQWYVPVGTVIDGNDLRWNGSVVLPTPLPLNAYALDDEAFEQMRAWYPAQLHHRLRYDPHNVRPK